MHVATLLRSAATFTRSLLRIGKGARATLVESFVAAGAKAYQVNDAVVLSVGDNADVAHIRLMDDAPRCGEHFLAVRHGRREHEAQLLQHDHRCCRQPLSGLHHAGGEGSRRSVNGVNLLRRPPARRHHAGGRSCRAELRQPRGLPRRDRRSRPFGVPGPHHRPSRRAEDRRQDDDPGAAAVGRGRGRQQAGARDLRRRRHLRPRRHRRRARRQPAVLSAGARPVRRRRRRRC